MKILVIDDDLDMGEYVCAAACTFGVHGTATTRVSDFLSALSTDTSLVFVDLLMPDMDGIELLRHLASIGCTAGIVLMSGVGRRVIETSEELAVELGLTIAGTLQKPFLPCALEPILRAPRASAPPRARAQNRQGAVISNGDLRLALRRDEFVLHYQPQIQIATGKLVGLEALVRWNHPHNGLIFPDDFIPRLEELGWIDEMGWLVNRRALQEIGEFALAGNNMADRTSEMPCISINVSVQSLVDLQFPDRLIALAKASGVPLDKITVEITESGLMQELTKSLDVLTRLRMRGIHLSVDDFGTGYAMMKQLRHVPATELKIDKSFIHSMMASENDRVMVKKTVELGHELSMIVVGEGIETAEHLEVMRKFGCDVAQGYFFTRPLPLQAAMAWVTNYRSAN